MQLELQSPSHFTEPVNPDRQESQWKTPRCLPTQDPEGFAALTQLEIPVKLAKVNCSRIELNSMRLSSTAAKRIINPWHLTCH